MKVLLGIVIGIVAIVVVGVLVLGYLGFVPGISNLLVPTNPRTWVPPLPPRITRAPSPRAVFSSLAIPIPFL